VVPRLPSLLVVALLLVLGAPPASAGEVEPKPKTAPAMPAPFGFTLGEVLSPTAARLLDCVEMSASSSHRLVLDCTHAPRPLEAPETNAVSYVVQLRRKDRRLADVAARLLFPVDEDADQLWAAFASYFRILKGKYGEPFFVLNGPLTEQHPVWQKPPDAMLGLLAGAVLLEAGWSEGFERPRWGWSVRLNGLAWEPAVTALIISYEHTVTKDEIKAAEAKSVRDAL